MLADAPVAQQLAAFEEMVLRNPVSVQILERLPHLEAPDCWLTAGAVFQTVWNVLTDQSPTSGIRDYDVNYFDPSDLSWEAEDEVITHAGALFADLPVEVEVRNEARVHLWYEQKFGVPGQPYTSTADAVASFPNMSSAFAVRRGATGLEVLAPYGFSDLFALRMRPNPRLSTRQVYEQKAQRWREHWPTLRVEPWSYPPTSGGR